MAMNALQKKQREHTISEVMAAADRLQAQGLPLTFRAIAEEADLSISTVLNPTVKNQLYKSYQIGRTVSKSTGIEDLKQEIATLKAQLKKAHQTNAQLRSQNIMLKNECQKNDEKYRKLLMRYATEIDKTITSI